MCCNPHTLRKMNDKQLNKDHIWLKEHFDLLSYLFISKYYQNIITAYDYLFEWKSLFDLYYDSSMDNNVGVHLIKEFVDSVLFLVSNIIVLCVIILFQEENYLWLSQIITNFT